MNHLEELTILWKNRSARDDYFMDIVIGNIEMTAAEFLDRQALAYEERGEALRTLSDSLESEKK